MQNLILTQKSALAMKLFELLSVIDSTTPIEVFSEKETFSSRSELPAALLERLVKFIKPQDNRLFIELLSTQKPKSLEELGFSFEAGV